MFEWVIAALVGPSTNYQPNQIVKSKTIPIHTHAKERERERDFIAAKFVGF